MIEHPEQGPGDDPGVGGIQEGPEGGRSTEQRPEGPESTAADADAGGRAHTSTSEGHPAGQGARSDRDVGGPVADEDAEPTTGRAKGDIRTKGFDSHS